MRVWAQSLSAGYKVSMAADGLQFTASLSRQLTRTHSRPRTQPRTQPRTAYLGRQEGQGMFDEHAHQPLRVEDELIPTGVLIPAHGTRASGKFDALHQKQLLS